MAVNLQKLKHEFEIRKWTKIIERHPYVAVLQLTGSSSWGRTNVKAKLLGDEHDPHRAPVSVSSLVPTTTTQPASTPEFCDDSAVYSVSIDARYAVSRHAREAALRTKYVGLCPLFRAGPAAVVYGTELDRVSAVVRRSGDVLNHAELVGGRFGDAVINGRVWNEVLESDGELAEWTRLLATLQRDAPALAAALAAPSRGLADVLQGGGAHRILRTLDARSRQLNEA